MGGALFQPLKESLANASAASAAAAPSLISVVVVKCCLAKIGCLGGLPCDRKLTSCNQGQVERRRLRFAGCNKTLTVTRNNSSLLRGELYVSGIEKVFHVYMYLKSAWVSRRERTLKTCV